MGFYDAKGYWREYGEGFYDFNGDWVSPGGAYHDAKGYLRSPGDGFYDAKGNYVLPGEPFYDIKGERHSPILESEIRKSFAEYEFGIAFYSENRRSFILIFWSIRLSRYGGVYSGD